MTDNELIDRFMGIDFSQYLTVTSYVNTKYDESWDALMPVVEKIESIAPNRVVIDCNECRIVSDRRFKVHTLKKINSVYQCVVQYIKWYNENRKP